MSSRNRELAKLREHSWQGSVEGIGVFAPAQTAKRQRIQRDNHISSVKVGRRYQADIPDLAYNSEERGDTLVQVEMSFVPVFLALTADNLSKVLGNACYTKQTVRIPSDHGTALISGSMAGIKFSLKGIDDQKLPLSSAPEQVGDIYKNLPIEQLSDELRFTEMGGTPVPIRSSIVRIAFMKLAASGLLAGLVGISTNNSKAAFSCCLAASVNFIACIHYSYIWRIRAQALPPQFLAWASGRDATGAWKGRTEKEKDAEKMFAQELSVDGFRHSDWAVTLVLMVLDLYDIAFHASGGVKSFLDKYIAAALMPVMIFLGGLYRFYASEFRKAPGGTLGWGQLILGVVGYFGSLGIFIYVVMGILDPISGDKCPSSNTTATSCPITDDNLKSDANAVRLLTLVWIGYPIVSVLSRLLQWNASEGIQLNAWNSLFKDLAYATLDVLSKGGLAMYACYRSTWM